MSISSFKIILLFLLIGSLAVAQTKSTGRIVGRILDSETGKEIVGANVFLEGTTKGAASDIDGRFSIQNIEPGTYTLVASVISYSKKRITNVNVKPGEVIQFDIVLVPEAIQTEKVVVEAKAVLSYEGALLTQRKKAAAISDGISAEQIKRSPDATSSDALRRVTGVTIVDNKFVFIRGTPERYSNTMLNGAAVASTEPDKRAFAFDLLPSKLIENIVITKSFTPDLPGDVTGGLVELNTIDFPPSLTLGVSASISYNTTSTFRSFITSSGGGRDFLGVDDGTRSLPAAFPRNLAERQYSSAELLQYARMLKNSWAPRQTFAPLNSSFSVSLGDGAMLFGQNFGFVSALSYRNSYETHKINRNEYEASGEPRFQYSGNQSISSVSWGAIGNWSYKISDLHKLSLRNTYSRHANNEVTQFSGIQHTDIGAEQQHTAIRYVSRAVYSGQLTGEHFLAPLNNMQIEWKAFLSSSLREEPDYRRIVYFREIGSNNPFTASLGFQANLKNGGRFYSSLRDQTNGISVNFSMPIASSKLKFGALTEGKSRNFSSRLLGIVVNGRDNGFTDADLLTLPIDKIFDPENFRKNGFSIDEYQNGTNNYAAKQTLTSFYAMLDFPLTISGNEFRFITGARVENSTQTVNSKDVSGQKDITIKLSNTDVLPSVNLVYGLNPLTNIRFAYSQTVNRPELRELAPFAYFDFNTQTTIQGNGNLQRSLVRHYDVRFEVFPRPGELLSASIFYKSFTNAIELVVVKGSALSSERTFMNANVARNYGIELEGRLGLGWLLPHLSNFSLYGNYSWIRSSVDVIGTEATIEKRRRPLQGQSPYIINLGLTFDHPTLGTSVNVLFNRFGPRIAEVATAYEEDVIEQPRSVVDVVLTQPIFQRYELKFMVKDMLAQEQIFLQGDKKSRSNQKGASYSLGLSFKI